MKKEKDVNFIKLIFFFFFFLILQYLFAYLSYFDTEKKKILPVYYK
jgi:hypothetical protein